MEPRDCIGSKVINLYAQETSLEKVSGIEQASVSIGYHSLPFMRKIA